MVLFELPSGYYCFQDNLSNGTLYGVRSNDHRIRDTLQFLNLQWTVVATSTTTSSAGYSCTTSLPSDWTYLIPDSVAGYLILGCFIGVALLVAGLFKVFQR